ncbi:SDR family NAD(P)-dependent oxidoreductase [Halalkalibaculum sp. DA384]|uniref:SDR family NAD(P)-dependent oxidoreductase n=1 Tax=Halalkalibaculum sp. DA384 TaxID=3373606 RepID=UPI0037550C01
MTANFSLTNKIIAITGGYGHLGRTITKNFLSYGAKVWVLGRNKDKYEMAFKDLKEKDSHRLFFANCDISSTSSIRAAFKLIFEESGSFDVLINNAFYMGNRESMMVSDQDWNTGVDGILSSVYRCIREGITYLKESPSARIINVASIHGMSAPDLDLLKPPHYGVPKAGVIQLTNYFASFLGKKGINVNTVTPGPFPADDVQKDEAYLDKLSRETCLNRIGNPEEVAGAFVFLASDASSYITGHNLIVDGGWTVG